MGACPGWYPVLTAAQRLGCMPWDLTDPDDTAPRSAWIPLVNGAAGAEAHAIEQRRLRAR